MTQLGRRTLIKWTSSTSQQIEFVRAHDDVIKWKHFPRYWPFVRGIHRSPVNSLHKGRWPGALMFSFICARIHDWVNNREAGDLKRHRAHYDVIVMIRRYLCVAMWLMQEVDKDYVKTNTWWHHQIETFSALLAICTGNSPHKGQWRGALMFSLSCAWINGWVNNGEAGDLRRHRAHYNGTVMYQLIMAKWRHMAP